MLRIFFMRPALFLLLIFGLLLGEARADESIRALQEKLQEAGFYVGDLTGVYDQETGAALVRYQIRRGLPITGRFDSATASSLGLAATAGGPGEPAPTAGTWRRLRNGDLQFVEQLDARENPPPARFSSPTPGKSPRPATNHVASRDQAAAVPSRGEVLYGRERLRDYVGAFVLAGLDPKVGAELEFFADRVDYFGERKVSRESIRRDLVRYDRRWPQREFRFAGHLTVEPVAHGLLEVTFPLRYELRGHGRRASGTVMKTIRLRKTGEGDLEIVSVNERKA